MSERFGIDCDWLPAEHGTGEERFTRAEVVIRVGDWCVTEVEDLLARSVRPRARLSAYHLALWFASNWWRLRWEPKREGTDWMLSHRMSAAGGGYVWPDLSLSSDGERVTLCQQPSPRVPSEPIRYLNRFETEIDAGVYEQGVDVFLEGMLARLASIHGGGEELRSLWEEIREERSDPERARWRKLEALLGHDPGDGPEGLIRALQGVATAWGEGAIGELAAASGDRALQDLTQLDGEVHRSGVAMRVPDLDGLRAKVQAATASWPLAWQQAEAAARTVRAAWSLDSAPITTRGLAQHLDLPEKRLRAQPSPTRVAGSAGLRRGDAEETVSVLLDKPRETSRRFALARLLGDHLMAGPAERLLPAVDAHTHRQKFQRAFAGALLCPYPSLRGFLEDRTPDDETIEDAAEHFNVSPLLVRTVLVNKHDLDRESLEHITAP